MEDDIHGTQSYPAGVTSCIHQDVTNLGEMWRAGISPQNQDQMWEKTVLGLLLLLLISLFLIF